MNPLKSLMALGLALALSQPAYCVPDRFDDGRGGQNTALGGSDSNIQTPQATPTESKDKTQSGGHVLVMVSAAIAAHGSDATKYVAESFFYYLLRDQYIKKSYRDKANAQNLDALLTLEKAIQSAVEKAQPPQSAQLSKTGELAALYIMIGPVTAGSWLNKLNGSPVFLKTLEGSNSWLDDKLQKKLASQAIREGTWPRNFEADMSCWREGSAGGKGCQPNEGPFAGTAGAKGIETDLDSWALGVTEKALLVAEQVAKDQRGAKEIDESIDKNDEGAFAGDMKGKQFSYGADFGAKDLYQDGAVYDDCLVVDKQNNHCRKISMKMTYNRDPQGRLTEAVTVCDITLPGVPGGTGCETIDIGNGRDIMLAGGQWHVGFSQSYDGGGLSVEMSLKSDPSVKKTTTLAELRGKLGKQAQDWADQGLCKAKIGAQNYVCVPFGHTLNVDDGSGNPVEVARGGLLYYPANDKFELLGDPPKPLFEADNTQSANGETIKLTPPNTSLGCAGFPVDEKGKLGKDAEFCNGGMDAENNFMYLMQNDEGIYVAVSCADAKKPVFKKKSYAGVTCKFPVPPVKKEVVPTSPAKGGGSDSGGGGSTDTAKTDPTSPKTNPDAGKTWYCDRDGSGGTEGMDKFDAKSGYKPIGVGVWTIYALSIDSPSNADRLCLNGGDIIIFPGLIPGDGITPSNGEPDNYLTDIDNHSYLSLKAYETGSGRVFVPYDHRNARQGDKPGGAMRTDATGGKPAFDWVDGNTNWKAPITKVWTYYVSPENLKSETLKAIGKSLIPSIDKVADITFVQSGGIKDTSSEPEEMTVQFQEGVDGAKALALIKDGFTIGGPNGLAAKRKQFRSDDDMAQLQRALAGVKSGVKSATVRLMWDKECGPSQTSQKALTVNGTEDLLFYDCASGGKFQTKAEHDQALQAKIKT